MDPISVLQGLRETPLEQRISIIGIILHEYLQEHQCPFVYGITQIPSAGIDIAFCAAIGEEKSLIQNLERVVSENAEFTKLTEFGPKE